MYFECQFSKECLKILLEWLGLETKEPDIVGIWRRLTRSVRGKMCRKIIIAVVAALVYKIWQVRNDAIWNNKVVKPQVICLQIQQECKIRVNMQSIRKEGNGRRKWIEELFSSIS